MKKLISFLLAGIILLCASACSSEPAKGSYDCNAVLGDGLSLKVTVSHDSENTKLYFVIDTDNSVFSSAVLSAAVNTQGGGDSENTGPIFSETFLRNKKTGKTVPAKIDNTEKSAAFDVPYNKIGDYELVYKINTLLNVSKYDSVNEDYISVPINSDDSVKVTLPDNHSLELSVESIYFDEGVNSRTAVLEIEQDYKPLFFDVNYKDYRVENGGINLASISSKESDDDDDAVYYDIPISQNAKKIEIAFSPVSYHKTFDGTLDLSK